MKNSVKELTEGMQRLCSIANRIVARPGDVSRIERDLLLEDLRKLYEVALRLDSDESVDQPAPTMASLPTEPETKMPDDEILSSTVMATMAAMSVPEPTPEPEPTLEPASIPEPEPEPEPIPEPEPEPVEMPKMEELESNGNSLLFDEVIIESEPEPAPEPEAESEPAPKPEPISEPEVVPAPASKTAGAQASLLDYLNHPVDEKPTVRTLGESLEKKVSDLRSVININDKFSFMSDLFHNNMKAYNDFILRLNAIDNRDEALLCVNEVSAQYKWDDNSPAVQSFYKVFDKKF